MQIRNLLFIGLLISTDSHAIFADQQIDNVASPALQENSSDDFDVIFGDDDAFADISIDLNCKPQKLPVWKRAGAWLFMKLYRPIKGAMLWWEKRNHGK